MSAESRIALVEEAKKHLGVTEDPPGSNRGVEVDEWNVGVGSPLGSAWCASFVNACVDAVTEEIPFKRSGSVQQMVDAAKKAGTFSADPSAASPGDLVVYFFEGLHRYGHIGVISEIFPQPGGQYRTLSIDGNTIPDDAGDSREGFGVFVKDRPVGSHTAFLLWPS